tara:strand:+ start:4761 stop:5273 length:513 start_codon:yes stop_codon:yes gene_type:complete
MVRKKKAQFQIQQMAFMIIALFIFFAIAGLFVLNISLSDVKSSVQDLKTEKAITFLSTLPSMTEFNFPGSCTNCIDKDKARVFSEYSEEYRQFFPLDSLKLFKVYPEPEDISGGEVVCPSDDCIILFNSTEDGIQEYSTFVALCEKSRRSGVASDDCEIWKMVGGVEFLE